MSVDARLSYGVGRWEFTCEALHHKALGWASGIAFSWSPLRPG
jgi:hypothetical protein